MLFQQTAPNFCLAPLSLFCIVRWHTMLVSGVMMSLSRFSMHIASCMHVHRTLIVCSTNGEIFPSAWQEVPMS